MDVEESEDVELPYLGPMLNDTGNPSPSSPEAAEGCPLEKASFASTTTRAGALALARTMGRAS